MDIAHLQKTCKHCIKRDLCVKTLRVGGQLVKVECCGAFEPTESFSHLMNLRDKIVDRRSDYER